MPVTDTGVTTKTALRCHHTIEESLVIHPNKLSVY